MMFIRRKDFLYRLAVLSLILIVSGCSIPGFGEYEAPLATVVVPTRPPLPTAEISFVVQIPSPINDEQKLYLDILDEITGLALNPKRYVMDILDQRTYTVTLPASIGSVVKYRYSREGTPPIPELTSDGAEIRYRMIYITGNNVNVDIVSGWNDETFSGQVGRIQGVVINRITNSPLAGILISIAGISTFSATDGSYIIDGIPTGTQNLVAYSLDGEYMPFQQGAVIASESATPANLQLEPTKKVSITFYVTPPAEFGQQNVPIRMVGNLLSFGNTFTDLKSGMNTIASRAPVLSQLTDGRYTISVDLPTGIHFIYKYSLGDGFWNSEHNKDGSFRLREILIPDKDTTFEDSIDLWDASGYKPIQFNVKVPGNTPPGDIVSIQFNPYGWTEPIPMWKTGENRWTYTLYGPMNLLGTVGYRYCRNDQCGVTDDEATMGINSQGMPFTTSLVSQVFQDEVAKWAWMQPLNEPTTVVTANASPREEFVAGVEIINNYSPEIQPFTRLAIQDIQSLGANQVMLSPSWSFTTNNPPTIENIAGPDALWQDIMSTGSIVNQQGMRVAVFPRVNYISDENSWWIDAKRDSAWWDTWFDRYARFLRNSADIAAALNAQTLILGDPAILPALPGGTLKDGSLPGVPQDIERKWQAIIKDIRGRFGGTILWAVPYPMTASKIPTIVEEVDGLYILWSAALSTSQDPLQEDLADQFGQLLDMDIKPFHDELNKTIVIGLSYPSADGASLGCILMAEICYSFDVLRSDDAVSHGFSLDLKEQVDLYNAAFSAINQRNWISGIISRGYYPPARLMDISSSVHGKPAADVIWYWYPRLLGTIP